MKKSLLLTAFILATVVLCPLVSSAMDVEGAYRYMEPGYTGTMTISRMGPGFVFAFSTTSKSNGQMCEFETFETPIDQGGGRIDDDQPAHGGTEDDGIKFKISFEGNNANVDVESKGGECGVSGYFGGKYEKIR